MATPTNPDVRLPREQTAAALKECGFPIESSTLATMATRGGGPPYQMFGRRALYRWGDVLTWAQSRLSAPRRNTSEDDAIDKAVRQHPDLKPQRKLLPIVAVSYHGANPVGAVRGTDEAAEFENNQPAKEDAPPADKRKGRPPEIRGRLGANADYNWPEIARIDAEEYWKFDASHGKAPSWEDRASLISDRIDNAPNGDYLRTSKRVAKIPAKPKP